MNEESYRQMREVFKKMSISTIGNEMKRQALRRNRNVC